MLSNCQICLCFDDFTYNPILMDNGTTQGCLLSMLIYAFYNADLIDIVKGKSKLSTSFVDDCAFVAVADTMDEAHSILNGMPQWGARLVTHTQFTI